MININKKLVIQSMLEIFDGYGYGKDGLYLLEKIGFYAEQTGSRAYLIGGFVRDVLIYALKTNPETAYRFKTSAVFNAGGNEIFIGGCPDIDIVLEGSADKFAESLKNRSDTAYKIKSVKIHERFGTASAFFLVNNRLLKLDMASARTEIYNGYGALPAVNITGTSLKNDVFRRDFTINTLAFSLKTDVFKGGSSSTGQFKLPFFEIIDYAGGISDILDKKIRVLHDLSFKEDPSRIFRAVRFEKRLGFILEKQTKISIEDALAAGVLDNISGKRITTELSLLLREKKPWVYFKRLQELGALKAIYPGIKFDCDSRRVFKKISLTAKHYKNEYEFLFCVAELLYKLSRADFDKAAARLALGGRIKKIIETAYSESEALCEISKKYAGNLPPDKADKPFKLKNSEIYLIFNRFSVTGILFYIFKDNNITEPYLRFKKSAVKYIDKIRFIKPIINGNDIKSLGIPDGPLYARILEDVKLLKLDGRLNSKNAEINFVRNVFLAKKGRD